MTDKFVPPEKLEELKQLQTTFDQLTKHFGELHYQKKIILAEIEAADEAFEKLEAARQKVSQELQSLFGGPGTVNLDTGVFVPTP